jgi:hypothetical protein
MAVLRVNIVQTGNVSGRLRASDRDVSVPIPSEVRAADAAILALLLSCILFSQPPLTYLHDPLIKTYKARILSVSSIKNPGLGMLRLPIDT